MIDTVALRKRILDLAIQGLLTPDVTIDEGVNSKVNNILIENEIANDIVQSDIPFEIKNTWSWIKLGWIMGIERGGSPRPIKDYITEEEDGINWIKIGDVSKDGKYIEKTKEKIKAEGEKKSRHVYPGDFLLTNSMSFGRPYITKIDGCVHDGWLILRNTEKLFDMNFLYHLLSSSYVYNQFAKKASGATVDNLNIDKVADAIIPLPPVEEQKIIVEKVEEMMQYIETIAKLQIMYSTDLEALKSKIIDAGIQGKLTEQLPEDGTAEELLEQIAKEKKQLIKEKKIKATKALPEITEDEIPFEIPVNWKWVRLADICSKITSGNTPAGGSKGGAYITEGNCFFREQNIYNDGIHYEGMVYITDELLATRENSTVLPQDILLNITGGSIGRCALIPDDFSKGSINQHILIIRVIEPEIRQYIHKCLCSPYYQKLIMGNVVGDKDGFSAGRCKNTLIPLPPIGEQKRIVEKITQILEQI